MGRTDDRPSDSDEPVAPVVDYYWTVARPILDAITAFASEGAAGAMVPATAHRLMETLNVFLPIEPGFCVNAAWSIARAAKIRSSRLLS